MTETIVNVAVIVAFVMVAQMISSYCVVKMLVHGRVLERQQHAQSPDYEAPSMIHRVS